MSVSTFLKQGLNSAAQTGLLLTVGPAGFETQVNSPAQSPWSRIAPGSAFHTINQMVIFVFLKVYTVLLQKKRHGIESHAIEIS